MSQFDEKEYRDEFVGAMVGNSIALQIRELRKNAELSQKKLAHKMGKKQSAISRLEDPDYGAFNVRTLLEMAKAFDVALLVKFIPFSELMERSRKLSPDDLIVPTYSAEKDRRTAVMGATETAVGCTFEQTAGLQNLLLNTHAAVSGVGHG